MTDGIRRVDHYSADAICAQWDRIAVERNTQLRSGRDLSFEFVLKPTILDLVADVNRDSVLDAGCGSGVLTEVLADMATTVVGVDMSHVNIELADRSKSRPNGVRYYCESIEKFATKSSERFSLIVANMVLQDSAELDQCLEALARLSLHDTILVASITHPWFWPTYWGYDKESWFKYSEEQAIEAPFRISTEVSPIGTTTHFHRPLSAYVAKLKAAGFELETIREPLPSIEVQHQYPVLWEYPRFLVLRCKRCC